MVNTIAFITYQQMFRFFFSNKFYDDKYNTNKIKFDKTMYNFFCLFKGLRLDTKKSNKCVSTDKRKF